MRTLRVLGLVLGSIFFVPVSCTSSLVGLIAVPWPWNQRDIAAGDAVPRGFPVLVAAADGTVHGTTFEELPGELAAAPGATPRLRAPRGSADGHDGLARYDWTLEADSPAQQTVALKFVDDDIDWDVRYAARADGVQPLRASVWSQGDLFTLFPVAFVFALLLAWFGRRLARRHAPASVPSAA